MRGTGMASGDEQLDGIVIEVDGLLWKPCPGARASAEEFVSARTRLIEIMDERDWNPWARPVLDVEFDAAAAMFEQWTRAEPGFRQLTDKELEDRLNTVGERARACYAAQQAAREERAATFDETLATARLELLEEQSALEHHLSENATVSRVEDREERCARLAAEIAQLQSRVGDVEEIVDQHGWLPRERREANYQLFSAWRHAHVKELIEQVEARTVTLNGCEEREEKTRLRNEISRLVLERDTLMGISRPRPQEMCSECPRPATWHAPVIGAGMALLGAGPCPAWPRWSERLERARRMLYTGPSPKTAAGGAPKPEPLAVIPSGLPLDEVIERLQEIRERYPTAQVKRGSRNRWEIWPTEPKHAA
jgi:hypothetical protein